MRNILKYFGFFIFLTSISCSERDYNYNGNNTIGSGIPDSYFKAVLKEPANNRTCMQGKDISETQSEVTFLWTDTIDTDFSEERYLYELIITDLNTRITVYSSETIGNGAKVILDKGAPYSWEIVTKNAKNGSFVTSSEIWKFYLAGSGIVNYVPFPAVLKTPVSGSTISRDNNGKVTFLWEGSDADIGDILRYTLYVDTIDGEQIPPIEQYNLSLTTLKVKLNSNSIYYWRIETSDGSDSSYSVVHSFRTK